MRRLPASESTSTGKRQRDERSEGGHQRRKTVETTSHADLLGAGLPALNELGCHQKVPSSVQECIQPTHSGDGTVGCTTCSPAA
jgi:hypothetical protein